jgi:hypothetical protein
MIAREQCWLHPWHEVNSDTYYASPALIRVRERFRLRTPRRALDAREAEALLRETLEAQRRFEADLDARIDQLFDTLFEGPSGHSDD